MGRSGEANHNPRHHAAAKQLTTAAHNSSKSKGLTEWKRRSSESVKE